jgi:DNA-binding LacI/PurR family transcriptional regulator
MSIAEVAKRAGVSRATVSRVINKRNGVSAEIAQAVRDAVAALGYQPPPLDRRPGRRAPLVSREGPGLIAVVVVDDLYQHTPGVFAAHLSGIEREAAEHGLGVLVVHLKHKNKSTPALASSRIEGLILLGSSVDESAHHSLSRFTSVWLSSHHDQQGDTVLAGNQQISRIAVDYLMSRGHRKLGFLAVMSNYPAYPARAEAFQFFAASAGADVSVFMDTPDPTAPMTMQDTTVVQERINHQVERLMTADVRPTGLFVPNDLMTAMTYVALRSRGAAPGRDIDIVSCNNEISYLVGLDPRPATIDIGAEMIGQRCVEQLLRKIRHPEESRQVQIAVTPVLIPPPSAARV